MLSRPLSMVLLCGLVTCTANAVPADEMSVQVKTTKVRDKESYLGTVLFDLHFGDRVVVIQKGSAWFKVRPKDLSAVKLASGSVPDAQSATGYINKSALTPKRIVLKSDQSAQLSASEDDVALAGKGFNEDVERTYQAKYPNLSSAYAALNQLEVDPTYSPSAEDVVEFQTAGGLGGGVK